jgi:PBSX family phage terminase large subunit
VTETADIYEPLGAAAELFRCRAERTLMDGPAGTGKTMAIQYLSRIVCEKHAGARVLWLRQTRKSMSDSVLVTWESKVLGLSHPMVSNGPGRPHRQSYTFPNGSQICLSGMDTPERTYSSEYDLVCVFEAIETKRDAVEQLLRTLRNCRWKRDGKNFTKLVLDTNPGAQNHWLNLAANEGWLRRLMSKHEDNPLLWDRAIGEWTEFGRQYIATLDALTGARKSRLRHGKWVSAEGAVYEAWDANAHVIDKMPEGWQSWRKVRAIDFGYTNPFVCQWWAIDDDGRAYLYREIYHTQRLVSKHAKDINRLSNGEDIEITVADHDAEDRATLAEEGINTVAANKAVEHGIQKVSDRVVKSGDNRPRIYILRDCVVERDPRLIERRLPTCTADEMDGYVWARNASGEIIKEVPVKENDHGCDAMRYAVAHIDSGVNVGVSGVNHYQLTQAAQHESRTEEDAWKPHGSRQHLYGLPTSRKPW